MNYYIFRRTDILYSVECGRLLLTDDAEGADFNRSLVPMKVNNNVGSSFCELFIFAWEPRHACAMLLFAP